MDVLDLNKGIVLCLFFGYLFFRRPVYLPIFAQLIVLFFVFKGSVKDAEEFDHLSPEESKRRLKILLLKMDMNQDSIIDRKELQAWILRSFR